MSLVAADRINKFWGLGPMHAIPAVALMLDASRGIGRLLLQGILRYSRLHGPWRFLEIEGDVRRSLERLNRRGAAGVIAQIDSLEIAEAISATRLPALTYQVAPTALRPDSHKSRLGEIRVDFRGAARLATEHLLRCGLGVFGVVGELPLPSAPSIEMERGVRERLSEAGSRAAVYQPIGPQRRYTSEEELAALTEWLKTLPRPVGLIVSNDQCGRQVLEASRRAGFDVPLEIAVIAIENDALLCELSDPSLSSVALDGEASGYRAATLLDRMMQGLLTQPGLLAVNAVGVVERSSTQAHAVEDRQVAAALDLIHRLAGQPIEIGDIVNGLRISRRALELRFRKAVGRGPHDELRRVRLHRAQKLLVETNLTIPQVAAAAGYSSGSYLAQVFQRQIGRSPAQFRSSHREAESTEATDDC